MTTSAELNQFLAGVEKRAYAMTVMAVKNPDDALDIVQDVMMTLARKYGGKPSEQWPPLFYRILQNRIRDFHRSTTVRRRIFTWFDRADGEAADPLEAVAAPEHYNPEHRSTMDGIAVELQSALAALPERQRQAFMLRAWEGLDVKRTAQAMGCSPGSVKTHFSRAIHTMRNELGEFYDA